MDITKTIVIWDNLDGALQFFTVNRDISHLNRIYINSSDDSEDLQAELSDMVYDDKGQVIVTMIDQFPVGYFDPENTMVIVAGFLP